MDGVSGSFAVISLTIQLVETSRRIADFVKSIKNASSEVKELFDSINQLHALLKYIKDILEEQYQILPVAKSPQVVSSALRTCEQRLRPLEIILHHAQTSAQCQTRFRRTSALTKFVLKKQEINIRHRRLLDAKFDLQLAVTGHSWELQ